MSGWCSIKSINGCAVITMQQGRTLIPKTNTDVKFVILIHFLEL